LASYEHRGADGMGATAIAHYNSFIYVGGMIKTATITYPNPVIAKFDTEGNYKWGYVAAGTSGISNTATYTFDIL